jgi:hypothetical protein
MQHEETASINEGLHQRKLLQCNRCISTFWIKLLAEHSTMLCTQLKVHKEHVPVVHTSVALSPGMLETSNHTAQHAAEFLFEPLLLELYSYGFS